MGSGLHIEFLVCGNESPYATVSKKSAKSGDGEHSPPAFLELEKILLASRAVEMSNETTEDLAYLQGKGTSLGGMRPKCTILDADGALSLGKFPSVSDERAVTRGEVLALRLARGGWH